MEKVRRTESKKPLEWKCNGAMWAFIKCCAIKKMITRFL
jgi:hypothetical protein